MGFQLVPTEPGFLERAGLVCRGARRGWDVTQSLRPLGSSRLLPFRTADFGKSSFVEESYLLIFFLKL